MITTALVLYGAYLTVGFIARTIIQRRRTGDGGFRGISGAWGTPQWWAGILFALALVTGFLGPVTALLGLEPPAFLSSPPLQTTGVVLAVLGIGATFWAQLQMGANWRIGVDPSERTSLVTSGVFAVVRNPIFTAMGITGLGLTLVVPNAIAIAGLVGLLVALELQVRVVEEPYLRTVHGSAYAVYAASTGRFLPRIGRTQRERVNRRQRVARLAEPHKDPSSCTSDT
jgi:protein-S-isoprenylcysteine O-methyltransferase Ste14